MNPLLSKYLFFLPVRYLRGEFILPFLYETKYIEGLSKEEIENYQKKKLKKMVRYCKINVGYYQTLLRTFTLNTIKDLKFIPVLEKSTIQKNINKFNSKEKLRKSKRSTSGSTGKPLTFYKDRQSMAYMDAVMYNCYAWHGVKIGDRQARFWGMPINNKKKWIERLKDFLMNRIRFSAFDLNDSAMRSFYHRILKFKPHYLYGYPSVIYEFALFLKSTELSTDKLNLKVIILTGEFVDNEQRRIIEDTFNTHVAIEYGCTELGVIAFSCKKNNLHVMSHNIILEVLKDDSQVIDEEEGEICVTELNSKESPFIRYRLGDRGRLLKGSCSCGLKFPILELTKGRIDDYIITPSGGKIYDAILAYTLKNGVIQYKAFQKTFDTVDLYIIKDITYNDKTEKEYRTILSTHTNNEIVFNFHYVEKIDHEKSGKLKYFVSEVR